MPTKNPYDFSSTLPTPMTAAELREYAPPDPYQTVQPRALTTMNADEAESLGCYAAGVAALRSADR